MAKWLQRYDDDTPDIQPLVQQAVGEAVDRLRAEIADALPDVAVQGGGVTIIVQSVVVNVGQAVGGGATVRFGDGAPYGISEQAALERQTGR